jgi:hypothetical protein
MTAEFICYRLLFFYSLLAIRYSPIGETNRVTLRVDHVAGGAFVAFGILVLAISGDLPVGRLSMPGAGMMPKLVTALMILFGLAIVARANESAPFSELAWSDVRHAGATAAITAAAVAGYERLGFLVTMALMLFALTAGVERKPVLHAALFSVGVTALTYALFTYALKSPLEPGILGFWQ